MKRFDLGKPEDQNTNQGLRANAQRVLQDENKWKQTPKIKETVTCGHEETG
jgi:hypothetical protein